MTWMLEGTYFEICSDLDGSGTSGFNAPYAWSA